jgi:phosphinothricin acetyltransferase
MSSPSITTAETRDLRPGDWPEVEAIFCDGIATGVATFETDAPSWESWESWELLESEVPYGS